MTTHLTGFDLIDRINRTGMQRVGEDDSFELATFASSEQRQVSESLDRLLRNGYTLLHSARHEDQAGDIFLMLLQAPGAGMPHFVDLHYQHRSGRSPRMALCYLDGGRLTQFTRPLQWWVNDERTEPAERLLERFKAEVAGQTDDPDAEGREYYWWVPILQGSALLHI